MTSPLFALNHYAILIDAGSSSSKLHIYEFDKSTDMPTVKDMYSESVKPGISSFATDPENAGKSLKTLLDDAATFLKNNSANLETTKIDVLATAGMRLLPEDQQQAIYANITDYIQTNYSYSIGEIKTISSKMEGLYGWLDINYLLGNFQNQSDTVGNIDMGGASTEIAFETTDTSKPNDEVDFTLNNKHYIVFSKSFLGLGQDESRDSMLSQANANVCFPQDYPMSDGKVGNYNFASCSDLYLQLLKEKHVSKEIIPTGTQTFVAHAGIYYTYNFFSSDTTPDRATFEYKLQNICNESWDQIQKDFPNISVSYLANYCADGTYESRLMYEAYKLPGSQLIISNQIGQTSIDWTLGAVLHGLIRKK